MVPSIDGESIANRLLLALPPSTLKEILPKLKRIDLPLGRVMFQPGDQVRHNHFINRGLVSLIKTMHDGRTVEVNTRGIEGVTAPEALFGVGTAILECVVQVPGTALSIQTSVLRDLMERHHPLNLLLQRYIHLSTDQMAQTAACNRLHSLEERCCRWLLIAHDSARADTFPLTHEFLAVMLGVQRPHVSSTAALLQKAGLIRYVRSKITIVDRAGLMETACECYADIEAEFSRYFSVPSVAG